uniref:Putative ovule protein n=1 Tax=Solanum chacoense TaxID=4108 RepID=A0A0V0HYF7_SOLCH
MFLFFPSLICYYFLEVAKIALNAEEYKLPVSEKKEGRHFKCIFFLLESIIYHITFDFVQGTLLMMMSHNILSHLRSWDIKIWLLVIIKKVWLLVDFSSPFKLVMLCGGQVRKAIQYSVYPVFM